MNTYDYTLKTDRYDASGQVDAETVKAAEDLIRKQVANFRKQGISMTGTQPAPQIKSLKLTLKTSV